MGLFGDLVDATRGARLDRGRVDFAGKAERTSPELVIASPAHATRRSPVNQPRGVALKM